MTMIRVDEASCTFQLVSGRQVQALNNVSLTIRAGEFVCLLGRSGHGKSTLLRSLAGLNRLTGGSITVDGKPVTGPGVDRGMVFQDDTVFPWMRVQDNVEFGLKAQGIPAATRKATAERWLAAVGLLEFAQSWPKELSGGMRKRVALARALALEPEILFLDEPTSGLDPIGAREFDRLVRALSDSLGLTVFMVTHDLDTLHSIIDRTVALSAGKVIADGPVATVMKSPHPWLQHYFSARAPAPPHEGAS